MTDAVVVTLGPRETAAPGTCGSCHFFIRRRGCSDTFGQCTIELPPWLVTKPNPPDSDSTSNARTVKDTCKCDLYKIKESAPGVPVTFVQERSWRAGQPQP